MKEGLLNTVRIVMVVMLLAVVDSCVDHDFGAPYEVTCDEQSEISYAADVKPIITEKCTGCHNSNNPGIPDWNVLDNLQANGSEIQRRITLPPTHSEKMPAEGSISDEERQKIFCWIEQGALDN